MSGYQQRIQGTDRLLRIRRMRRFVYLALLLLTIALMYARILAEGASLKPIFIPLDGILEVGLIMGLVGTVIGFYLRNLEIRRALHDSQRYLMSKYSMSRALTTAILAVILAVVLILPASSVGLAAAITDPPQSISIASNTEQVLNLTTPDAFGLTFVRQVVVTADSGSVKVSVFEGSILKDSATVNTAGTVALDIQPTGWTFLSTWSVHFTNATGSTGTARITYSFPLGVMPTLFSTVPFLLFLYAAANGGWWFGLRPVRERTKAMGLYASSNAAAQIDMGERQYIEYAMQPQTWPAAAPMAMDPPPPPPMSVPPPPPGLAPTGTATPPPMPPVPHRAPQPDTAETFAAKGDTLAAIQQYPSAIAAYDESLRLDPGRVPVLLSKAAALAAMRSNDAALDAYRRVLALDPTNDAAQRGTMRVLASLARWRESLEAVEPFLQRRPNDVVALQLKGDVLANLGRRPEALAAYEAAAALDSSDANLRQKIEEVRVDVPGLLSRALISSASGNYAQALTLFDDILEVEPGNVNALIGKAVAYRRSGKSSEALNCLDMVLHYQPNNASALLNRGHLLAEGGDLDGALEAFNRLVAISPGDEEAWIAQAETLLKLGRDEDGLRAYSEALKLNPGDEEVQSRIHELEVSKAVSSDILQDLYAVKGVGPARAKALVDAGFKTAEDFQKATVEQLVAVKGITHRIAEDLVKHFRSPARVRA